MYAYALPVCITTTSTLTPVYPCTSIALVGLTNQTGIAASTNIPAQTINAMPVHGDPRCMPHPKAFEINGLYTMMPIVSPIAIMA